MACNPRTLLIIHCSTRTTSYNSHHCKEINRTRQERPSARVGTPPLTTTKHIIKIICTSLVLNKTVVILEADLSHFQRITVTLDLLALWDRTLRLRKMVSNWGFLNSNRIHSNTPIWGIISNSRVFLFLIILLVLTSLSLTFKAILLEVLTSAQ